jgi:hypothetical protein
MQQDSDKNENVPTETHRCHEVAHPRHETVHTARVFSLDPNLPGYIGVPNADAQVQTPNKKNHCFLMMSGQLTHFTADVHDELDRAAPYPSE